MTTTLSQSKQRIQSIDVLRGIVMIIMALDHVRDYFHIYAWTDSPTNMATTTPQLFFTRWITHFCAPIFIFLSGISAYMAGQRKTKAELSSFLLKRGLWLVFIELVVITFGWTFDPLYHVIILQVIWAIGWSMIILGVLVKTSIRTVMVTGFIIFFAHNITDYIDIPKEGITGVLWNVLLTSPFKFYFYDTNRVIADVYAILPWTGVMFLGYGFGYYYKSSISFEKRNRRLLLTGSLLILLFMVLRFLHQYGDPAPMSQQRNGLYTFLSFLNTTKYPVSLQYLCMSLGPALLFLAFFERWHNRSTKMLTVYGRVPFFFYVVHIYFIHIICVIIFFGSGYGTSQIVDVRTPFFFRPQKFGFDLPVVYIIWVIVIIILYVPCKWFNKYKSTHNQWWVSYV